MSFSSVRVRLISVTGRRLLETEGRREKNRPKNFSSIFVDFGEKLRIYFGELVRKYLTVELLIPICIKL